MVIGSVADNRPPEVDAVRRSALRSWHQANQSVSTED